MTPEELIKFLKENLKITTILDRDGDLNVVLLLCEKEISRDWVHLPYSDF